MLAEYEDEAIDVEELCPNEPKPDSECTKRQLDDLMTKLEFKQLCCRAAEKFIQSADKRQDFSDAMSFCLPKWKTVLETCKKQTDDEQREFYYSESFHYSEYEEDM